MSAASISVFQLTHRLIYCTQISAPTTLAYLSSQVLYVGSHTGDSELLHIHSTPQGDFDSDTLAISSKVSTVSPASLKQDPRSSPLWDDEDVDMEGTEDKPLSKAGQIVRLKGTYIEVLDRFRNIAPITDAVMADTDASGQVCSGRSYTQVAEFT